MKKNKNKNKKLTGENLRRMNKITLFIYLHFCLI